VLLGHLPENVLYLELLRRSQHVYIGKVGQKEVDFITSSGEGPAYYQVAAALRDNETLKRELEPLLSIDDQYPKYVFTLDEDPPSDYQGILSGHYLYECLRVCCLIIDCRNGKNNDMCC